MIEKEYSYSFIIPHKNCPDLLKRCVDSIPVRDDVQIIVVDDNSDEDKKPQIDREGVELVLLYADQSKGAGRARNAGLERSHGKWLLFVDSDDFFSQDINAVLNKYADDDSDIIFFKSKGLDSKTLEINDRGNPYNTAIDKYLKSQNSMTEGVLRFAHMVPWGKMIKRSLVESNRIRFEEVRFSNDVMFAAITGFYAKKINAVDVAAYCITVREGSLVTQVSAESKKCRFGVSVRRDKFLWDNHRWHTITALHPLLINSWSLYGYKEFCDFVKIMKGEGVQWRHVFIFGLIHLYYALLRKISK